MRKKISITFAHLLGLDEWEYEFTPEKPSKIVHSDSTEMDSDARKKVTFAEMRNSTSIDSLASQLSHGSPSKANKAGNYKISFFIMACLNCLF